MASNTMRSFGSNTRSAVAYAVNATMLAAWFLSVKNNGKGHI